MTETSIVLLVTKAHRAMGSRGLALEVTAQGKVTRWRLRDGGVWTTADLSSVQWLYEQEKGEGR